MNNQNKIIIIAVIAVLALAAGAFVYFTPASAPSPAPAQDNVNPAPTGTPAVPPSGTPASSTPTSTPAPSGITMAQVASHSNSSSCWTAIRGNVYDLTSWISRHPGGEQAILQICGKDGTAAFTGQHGGSPRQENLLTTFKIGVLAQ